jgi:hypothetical protein
MRKPVVRIVVVLSVLTLAGIVALAAGGHHGIVTSQDGRLAIATKGPSHITPGKTVPSGLTTIAGNLSAYPNGVYFCCYGDTISGPDSFLGAAYWIGIPFTPSVNYSVKEIKAAVGWGQSGTNGVTLSLNADANGLPGAALASENVSNLGIFGDCCTLAIAGSHAGITVNAGTQYWVVVSTSSSTETTFDAWSFNTTDMRDYPYAYYNSTNGGWASSDGLLPGYAVLGVAE